MVCKSEDQCLDPQNLQQKSSGHDRQNVIQVHRRQLARLAETVNLNVEGGEHSSKTFSIRHGPTQT